MFFLILNYVLSFFMLLIAIIILIFGKEYFGLSGTNITFLVICISYGSLVALTLGNKMAKSN